MMVAFYLPERWSLVQARCAQQGGDEDAAAREELGLALDEIGKKIAQQWGLPSSLVNSLQHVHPLQSNEPLDHTDWLAAVSSMSTRCADILHRDQDRADTVISSIAGSYADMLGLDRQQLIAAVDTAQTTAEEDAVFVRPGKPVLSIRAAEPRTGKPADAVKILATGVVDMRGVLGTMNTAQLMTMALEIVYKGLGLNRAVVFLRNQDEGKYAARMCFGDGVQELLPRLSFSDAYQPDVFHAALANDKMIFVENALDPSFGSKLPRWWKEVFTSSLSFVVLPLTVNRHAVGFIYGDWETDVAPGRIEPAEVAPLNELRALVVHAIENRRRMDSSLIRKII